MDDQQIVLKLKKKLKDAIDAGREVSMSSRLLVKCIASAIKEIFHVCVVYLLRKIMCSKF